MTIEHHHLSLREKFDFLRYEINCKQLDTFSWLRHVSWGGLVLLHFVAWKTFLSELDGALNDFLK
jgi:hypothetical protein